MVNMPKRQNKPNQNLEKFTLTQNLYGKFLLKTETKRCKSSTWAATATIASSMNAAALTNPVSMASIVYWNMAGTGLTPKVRRLNLNKRF